MGAQAAPGTFGCPGRGDYSGCAGPAQWRQINEKCQRLIAGRTAPGAELRGLPQRQGNGDGDALPPGMNSLIPADPFDGVHPHHPARGLQQGAATVTWDELHTGNQLLSTDPYH